MDRDVFSKVRPLGRKVGILMVEALQGHPWDPALLCQLLDKTLAGGLPSLEETKEVLRRAARQPLFALDPDQCDLWYRAIDAAARRGKTLDLIFAKHAKASLLAGSPDCAQCFQRALEELLCRAVLDCRGGLLQQLGPEKFELLRPRLLQLAGPQLWDAARRLAAHPRTKRLGLAKLYRLHPGDDLLSPPFP